MTDAIPNGRAYGIVRGGAAEEGAANIISDKMIIIHNPAEEHPPTTHSPPGQEIIQQTSQISCFSVKILRALNLSSQPHHVGVVVVASSSAGMGLILEPIR